MCCLYCRELLNGPLIHGLQYRECSVDPLDARRLCSFPGTYTVHWILPNLIINRTHDLQIEHLFFLGFFLLARLDFLLRACAVLVRIFWIGLDTPGMQLLLAVAVIISSCQSAMITNPLANTPIVCTKSPFRVTSGSQPKGI